MIFLCDKIFWKILQLDTLSERRPQFPYTLNVAVFRVSSTPLCWLTGKEPGSISKVGGSIKDIEFTLSRTLKVLSLSLCLDTCNLIGNTWTHKCINPKISFNFFRLTKRFSKVLFRTFDLIQDQDTRKQMQITVN